MNSKKAIVLISGGLDSATTLAIARSQGFDCYAMSFDYGQKNIVELSFAKNIVKNNNCIKYKIIKLDLGLMGGSALTDNKIDVPTKIQVGIPVTYVPVRNTLFLSYALAWAEILEIHNIFIGVNAVDYSGYPDCRPEFIKAYERLAGLATKAGVEGVLFRVHTPLINLTKAEIIKKGNELGVDYKYTVSCYSPNEKGYACGLCDSCRLRKEGFFAAKSPDPTNYIE